MFATVAASAAERRARRPGDDLVDPADVVMDRAVTFDAAPEAVWPWLVQLGKHRAGWYLPLRVERFLPAGRRATRQIQPRWQHLQAGDIIPFNEAGDVRVEVAANGRNLYVCEFGRSGARYTVRVKDTYGSEDELLQHIIG